MSCSTLIFNSSIISVRHECAITVPTATSHYYKTCLLQLGFSTSTSEKTKTLLTWKTTSRFRQAVKCGHSHVGQDVPNGHVPNGSEV